jgi:hypothetical protein
LYKIDLAGLIGTYTCTGHFLLMTKIAYMAWKSNDFLEGQKQQVS